MCVGSSQQHRDGDPVTALKEVDHTARFRDEVSWSTFDLEGNFW
jgi:hypothetical protein